MSLSFIKKQCDILIAHDSIFMNKEKKKSKTKEIRVQQAVW